MAVYALGDSVPEIHPDAYVHPEATVIGDADRHGIEFVGRYWWNHKFENLPGVPIEQTSNYFHLLDLQLSYAWSKVCAKLLACVLKPLSHFAMPRIWRGALS